MKQFRLGMLAAAVIALSSTNAMAQDGATALGGGLGGAAGAALGQAVGGSKGAVVGGAVGGATGAAVSTPGGQGRTGAIVGGAVGGGAGAAVGQSMGGKSGAVVGAGVGGAAGAVVGRNVQGGSTATAPAGSTRTTTRVVTTIPSSHAIVIDGDGCYDKWNRKAHPGKGWAKGHSKHAKGC